MEVLLPYHEMGIILVYIEHVVREHLFVSLEINR